MRWLPKAACWHGNVWRQDGGKPDLEVGGGNWVAGAVRVGEGIEEGVEGALHQLNEGLLDGVLLAATQHTVLQDVGNALAVLHRGPEYCSKGLVLILVQQRHHLSTCTRHGTTLICWSTTCQLDVA